MFSPFALLKLFGHRQQLRVGLSSRLFFAAASQERTFVCLCACTCPVAEESFLRLPAPNVHRRFGNCHGVLQPTSFKRTVRCLLLAPSFPLSTLFAQTTGPALSPTSIFSPVSTPANSIFGLSLFVIGVTAIIFVVVFSLLVYTVLRFRSRRDDDGREPPQVYGSNQVELAWTVIPILIVVTLFMATARVIAGIQEAVAPADAVKVMAIGHQFWWEFRYPMLKVELLTSCTCR